MILIRSIFPAILAAGLFLAPFPGGAADDHSHDGHGSAVSELRLDDGRKWRGDEPMERGMAGIRRALESRLHAAHEDRLAPADYTALATALQERIDYMVANCRLPPDADEQLHIVLGEILEGIGTMEGGRHPRDGAIRVVRALNAYGTYFEHPGWRPLGD